MDDIVSPFIGLFLGPVHTLSAYAIDDFKIGDFISVLINFLILFGNRDFQVGNVIARRAGAPLKANFVVSVVTKIHFAIALIAFANDGHSS